MKINEHPNMNDALKNFGWGYLEKRGWFKSLGGIPRDKHGYVPWITYPAFLQLRRITQSWGEGRRVFEYGCGSSSLWWASNAAQTISVEHNAQWAQKIPAPDNLKIIVREIGANCSAARRKKVEPFFANPPELPVSTNREHNIIHGMLNEEFIAYATEITELEEQSLDVVVIDGMARTLTAWLATRYVKPDGIIVFDNSDRWQYNSAYRLLNEAGFRRIDFYGPGPVNSYEWCTSLFVRSLEIFATGIENRRGNYSDIGW